MESALIDTRLLDGKRVFCTTGKDGRSKLLGTVEGLVFHPSEKRCIGLSVIRKSSLAHVRRKNLFVALDSFCIDDDGVHVLPGKEATGDAACRRLGIAWDECVFWVGLKAMTESGISCGTVENVTIAETTGAAAALTLVESRLARALLGTVTISADEVIGIRADTTETARRHEADASSSKERIPALIVSDSVLAQEPEGGLAAQAGQASARIANKAGKTMAGTTAKLKGAAKKTKPKAKQAAQKASAYVDKGAFALGRQVGRSSGMFAAFRDEFKKGLDGEDADKT